MSVLISRGGVDPIKKGQRILDQVGTTCDGDIQTLFGSKLATSYYFGPVGLPVLSCGMGVTKCSAVTEYRNVRFRMDRVGSASCPALGATVSDDIDIEWKGCLTIDYSDAVTRHIADGQWGAWENPIKKKEVRPYILERLVEDNNDEWSSVVGTDIFKLPLFDLDQMMAGRASCEDIRNPAPHTGSTPHPKKPASIAHTLAPISGSATEFAAAFPHLLEEAALARALDPETYEKELKAVIDIVQTCTQVTPEMARQAGGTPIDSQQLAVRFDDKYRVCQARQSVTKEVRPTARGPYVELLIDFNFMVTSQQYKPGVPKNLPITVNLVGKTFVDTIAVATLQ